MLGFEVLDEGIYRRIVDCLRLSVSELVSAFVRVFSPAISGVNRYIAAPNYKSRRGTCSSVALCPRHNLLTKGESLVIGGHGEISRIIYGHDSRPPVQRPYAYSKAGAG